MHQVTPEGGSDQRKTNEWILPIAHPLRLKSSPHFRNSPHLEQQLRFGRELQQLVPLSNQ